MTRDEVRRTELARFLRGHRAGLSPAAVGLTATGSRRTPGLRREEVSLLSGVSLTWYTWLEQGRDISPSLQVVNALARTLQLSDAERRYLLDLSGHTTRDELEADSPGLPAHAARLLEALGDSPAFIITASWSILGWNQAYQAFYPTVASVGEADRNLLWLVFTDPVLRDRLPNWGVDSGAFLAQFRAENGPRVHHPEIAHLVDRLSEASSEFRTGWQDHTVATFTSRARHFTHPAVGPLVLESHRLSLSDSPGLALVVYTPTTPESAADLARMRSLAT